MWSRVANQILPVLFPRPTSDETSTTAAVPHTNDIDVNVDEIDESMLANFPDFSAEPRINRRLDNLVEMVGLDAVSSRSAVDRAYHVSEGTMLGLRLGEKFYDYDSSYVKESEIRRVCTGQLLQQSQGKSVVWLEAAGVMESGYGYQGTLALGDFSTMTGALAYGFSAGSVLRFRVSQAFMLGSNQNKEELIKSQRSFYIPKTAAEAKLMPFGTEVEITGQGKVNQDTSLSLRAGPSVVMATAGVTLDVGSNSNITDEVSLNVTALDGYRKVRVTIRTLDREAASFSAALRAGLIFPPGSLQPCWGAGLLKYLVASLNYKSIEELVNAYTTFSARYAYLVAHQGTILASYDFDLNHPDAAKAYEDIVKLSTTKAQELSKTKAAGVEKVLAEESETSSSHLVDLTLLGQKLYLRETLKSERLGRLLQNGKEIMIYRDSMFKKRVESWFAGIKDIEWQAVSVLNKDTNEKIPYFRFHFQKKDYDGIDVPKIDDYFRFGQSMGIYSSELTENVPESMGDYNAALTTAKEVDTDIDIYFTKEAIKRIDAADKQLAYKAFLDSSADIFPKYKKIPLLGDDLRSLKARELIREYCSLKNETREDEHGDNARIPKEYWSLTGRDLKKDIVLVKEAEEFAEAINALTDAEDAEQIATFFLKFGKKNGFNFMQIISALQKLAHPDNTLIHSMSLNGGGIFLQSKDEGVIEHPRDLVMDVLTRAI